MPKGWCVVGDARGEVFALTSNGRSVVRLMTPEYMKMDIICFKYKKDAKKKALETAKEYGRYPWLMSVRVESAEWVRNEQMRLALTEASP